MDPDTPVTRSTDQVASHLPGGGITLLHITHGRYYTLEGVGARLWDLLATPHSARQLGLCLVREYEVTPTQAASDVDAFLASLLAADLLQPA